MKKNEQIVVQKIEKGSELKDATVRISGYFYLVDVGPSFIPQAHSINKSRRCSCTLGVDCPAIPVVMKYLKDGGERSPDVPQGYYAEVPEVCPICGAKTFAEPKLCRTWRGEGWICAVGGEAHFRQDCMKFVAKVMGKKVYRFPPVVIRAGEQVFAWDGVKDGDKVILEGVKFEEIGRPTEVL